MLFYSNPAPHLWRNLDERNYLLQMGAREKVTSGIKKIKALSLRITQKEKLYPLLCQQVALLVCTYKIGVYKKMLVRYVSSSFHHLHFKKSFCVLQANYIYISVLKKSESQTCNILRCVQTGISTLPNYEIDLFFLFI